MVFCILTVSCSTRHVDLDEAVFENNLGEVIREDGGIYYSMDHLGEKTSYTGTDTCHYYVNYRDKRIKSIYSLKDGVPEGHWLLFDDVGTKTVDLYFVNGKVTKRIKGLSADK
jgi:hypothetical protein